MAGRAKGSRQPGSPHCHPRHRPSYMAVLSRVRPPHQSDGRQGLAEIGPASSAPARCRRHSSPRARSHTAVSTGRLPAGARARAGAGASLRTTLSRAALPPPSQKIGRRHLGARPSGRNHLGLRSTGRPCLGSRSNGRRLRKVGRDHLGSRWIRSHHHLGSRGFSACRPGRSSTSHPLSGPPPSSPRCSSASAR